MPVNSTNATRVAIPFQDKTATYERRVGQWTGPASYPTGGEAVNIANTFGFGRLMAMFLQPFSNGSVIILACWTPSAANSITAGTLKFFDMAGVEIANGTDLSTYTAAFEAIGR
jgi:hypothetical protein